MQAVSDKPRVASSLFKASSSEPWPWLGVATPVAGVQLTVWYSSFQSQLSVKPAMLGARCGEASTSGRQPVGSTLPTFSLRSPRQRRAFVLVRQAAPSMTLTSRERNDFDLVLSSGFLAFAAHSGFLQAVEEAGIRVSGVMGTSAGALAGSLWAAGYSPREVAQELSRDPPISLLRPGSPWKGGVLNLDGVIERLSTLLPPTFEDLDRYFAVGVVTADGEHKLIDSGPLPEAVAASAAIPVIFESVEIPGHHGNPYKDGGVVDRIGLRAWREHRRQQLGPNARVPPALVHLIARSSPFSGWDNLDAMGEQNVAVVRSPKSGVNFFSLGEFETQMNQSIRRARPVIQAATQYTRPPSGNSSSTTSSSRRTSSEQRSPERKRFVRTTV